MAFFADSGAGGFEPKRQFRFLINFPELSNVQFMAKTAKKPSYELGSTEHKVLNHTFKFPSTVTWQDIDVTFIDAVEPNVGSKFYNSLIAAGYLPPSTEGNLLTGITKVNSVRALGEVVIKQLDGGGVILEPGADPTQAVVESTNILEEWTLKNAFIKSVDFGDFSYDSEDLVEVSVGITYDWAVYSAPNSAYESG